MYKYSINYLYIKIIERRLTNSILMKDHVKTNVGIIKPGTKIKIKYLNDPYVEVSEYKDKVFTVECIDDINQIHLKELSVAVIPEIDIIEIV